ncbi:MAG: methionine synthase [Anaerolineae bacterium]|nr:methionine synthase [Anaerolineae bacterium]NIN96554.1 methionine synthase [Anaerolineae bacterium]NIQ79583.1 methionine synthase [Anaerolineae bacterium]
MSARFKPQLLPMTVGSLPHTEAQVACDLIMTHFAELPGWPQLPKRSYLENMYVQFSAGFPGIVREENRIYVDRTKDLSADLERLYRAYLENDVDAYEVSADYAAGLALFLQVACDSCRAVKGQVTGPVSWGLTVVDQDRRPVLYDEVLADAVAKHLRLKAAWQEARLRRLHPTTIMLVDEPYMSSFGSAYVPVTRDQVLALLEEVLGGLRGLKGIHCCGNTDWSLVLSTSVDILSFDTYEYSESLSLYAGEVRDFLQRGGIIAWGIVPRDVEKLADETMESLVDRLHQAMKLLVRKGIALDDLLGASLVSPCCGLGTLSLEDSERALALTAGVSREMRRRYVVT